MNVIGEYWKTLGRRLDAEVAAQGSTLDFSRIATRALEDLPPPRMTAAGIAEWMIAARSLPEQVNFTSGFGEPPLVVYQGPTFYVEVLFWFPSPTAIHGHAFTGAFVVLDGFSIEVRYDFHEERQVEEGVLIGRLSARELEFIGPGKVCAILGASDYVHSVTHLGNPSLTLVARTYGNANKRQYRFHRSGFAVCSNFNRAGLTRQAEVLAAIWRASPDEFPGLLTALLAAANDHAFYGVTEALLRKLPHAFCQNDVLPLIDRHFSHDRAGPLTAIHEVFRSRSLWTTVRALPSARAQVQVALADAFPDPAERDAILRRSYGDGAHQLSDTWRELVSGTVST